MLCTFIGTLCKYTTRVMQSLKRFSRCYWSAVDCDGWATCSWSRLMALLLGRLLGVLLFTEARLVRRAVQWSPMKPESWSGWFPLKSSLLRWPGDCSWSQLMALLLGRLLGVLLFAEAHSMGRAVQWSQRVDLAGFHSSLCRPAPVDDYITTYRMCHANCTAGMYVLTGPRHLVNWLTELNCVSSTALRRTQV
jgi:hypothetical protein